VSQAVAFTIELVPVKTAVTLYHGSSLWYEAGEFLYAILPGII
jgi:hypothetical protein